VQEYWLVDPGTCSLERGTRAGSERVVAGAELVWRPPAYGQAIGIELDELFKDVGESS
jgi:hypothetical protein